MLLDIKTYFVSTCILLLNLHLIICSNAQENSLMTNHLKEKTL